MTASAAMQRRNLQLETASTHSRDSFSGPTALTIALLVATQPYGQAAVLGDSAAPVLVIERRLGTLHITEEIRVSEADVLRELLSFQQRLVNSQEELPDPARRVLHDNLWQLYE